MQKHFAKLFGVAVSAAAATAAIPFALVILFSAVAPSLLPYESSGPNPKVVPGTVYTFEELEKARRDAEARIKASDPAPAKSRIVDSVRNGFWWCTWIPWIVIPFLVNIRRHPFDLLVLVAPLLLLTLLTWIQPVEGILASVALLLSSMLKTRKPRVMQHTNPPN